MYRVLLSNLPKLRDKKIKFYTDDNNLKFILNSEQLHETSLEFHKLCEKYQISLVVDWIPRSEKSRTDHLNSLRLV